jgi:hypothetical protein
MRHQNLLLASAVAEKKFGINLTSWSPFLASRITFDAHDYVSGSQLPQFLHLTTELSLCFNAATTVARYHIQKHICSQ